MPRIEVGRYGQILGRLLNIADRNPSGDIAPEIVPTLQLEGNRPEWAFLGGMRNCASGASISAGGASTTVEIYLTNPTGSNALAIFEECTMLARTTGYVTYIAGQMLTPNTSPNVGTFASVAQDGRDPANIAGSALQTACRVEGHITASSSSNRAISYVEQFQAASGAVFPPVKIDGCYVLVPGTQLVFYYSNQNVQGAYTLRWRERELTLQEQ